MHAFLHPYTPAPIEDLQHFWISMISIFLEFQYSKNFRNIKNTEIWKSCMFVDRHVGMYVLPQSPFIIQFNMLHQNIYKPFLCHITI